MTDHRSKSSSAKRVAGRALAVVAFVLVLGITAGSAIGATSHTSGAKATIVGNTATGGKLFISEGCSGCHTLKAAHATGKVGPNLNTLKPAYAAIIKQVTNGGGVMPSFKGKLSTAQIQDVAAYVYKSTH